MKRQEEENKSLQRPHVSGQPYTPPCCSSSHYIPFTHCYVSRWFQQPALNTVQEIHRNINGLELPFILSHYYHIFSLLSYICGKPEEDTNNKKKREKAEWN